MSILLDYRRFLKAGVKLFHIQPNIGQYILQTALKHRLMIKQVQQFRQSIQHQKAQNINERLIQKKLKNLKFKETKINEKAEILNQLSVLMQNSMSLDRQKETRTFQQKKIIRLTTNSSQFITNDFKLRKSYQSRVLGQLDNDMQFQLLDQNDKQFVKKLISHIFVGKKGNRPHSYDVKSYVKDYNSEKYQNKYRIINFCFQKNQKQKLEKSQKIYQQQYDREQILKLLKSQIPQIIFQNQSNFCYGVIQKFICRQEHQNKYQKEFKQIKKQYKQIVQSHFLTETNQERRRKGNEFILEFINSKIIFI